MHIEKCTLFFSRGNRNTKLTSFFLQVRSATLLPDSRKTTDMIENEWHEKLNMNEGKKKKKNGCQPENNFGTVHIILPTISIIIAIIKQTLTNHFMM